ncbi:MAG: TRAP transporter large permease [Sneathiellaceae bacterium]
MIWLVLFGSLFGTVAAGAALGAALGLTGMIVLQFFARGATELAVQAVWNVLNNFSFSAVPMFILMGEILVASGLSARIYGAVAPLFRNVPGKLLHTNIAVCTLFGAVSGSSTATAAAVGSAAYPELSRRGYDRSVVLGSLAAGGTLGLLIPPSLSLIIYGAWQEVSIGKLFLAGILPGLMMAALFMTYILFLGLRRPEAMPREPGRMSVFQVLRNLLGIWPLLVLVAAVLGTIYGGFATVTEAAGLGALAAFILGFATGELTLKGAGLACLRAVASFGALFFVVIGAVVLGQSISILGLPRELVEFMARFDLGRYEVLLLIVLLYVVLGCFFDGISLMLMTLPFIFPIMMDLQFDPIWLGVVITIMIEIGMITPPVGVNLYVLAAITRQAVPLGDIAKAAFPYWVALLAGTFLLTLFPGIATWLPRIAG